MEGDHPSVVVLAGPNGAGKSTMAAELLRSILGPSEFLDADVLARGIRASNPQRLRSGLDARCYPGSMT